MADLASAVGLSPSGLTRRVDVLLERGWLRRDHCEDDLRGIVGVLTGVGVRQLSAAAPIYECVEAALRRDVATPEDLEVFERVLIRINSLE